LPDERERVLDPEVMKGAPEGAEIWRIWPDNGVPPGSERRTWRERTTQVPWMDVPQLYTRNVVVPTVTVHRPAAGRGNGTAMIVAPGGGFHFLLVQQEGHDMARWITQLGVTVLVLKYRLMRTPDDDALMSEFRSNLLKRVPWPDDAEPPLSERMPLADFRPLVADDGRQAILFARANAKDLGIDPAKVGIVGYSAGGGVAIGAAMQHDAETRPAFAVGIYPWWPRDLPVPPNAPPLFLAMADDDKLVDPLLTTQLNDAWHNAGASVELHSFADGGHGFAMNRHGHLSDIWTKLLENWLRLHGFL